MRIPVYVAAVAACTMVVSALVAALLSRNHNSDYSNVLRLDMVRETCPESVIQGQTVLVRFVLTNGTNRSMRIEKATTGCGCALLTVGESTLIHQLIEARERREVTLTVNTTGRAGGLLIPIALLARDEDGQMVALESTLHINVDPGWIALPRTIVLDAQKADSDGRVSGTFTVLQVSDVAPFDMQSVTANDDMIKCAVEPISDGTVADSRARSNVAEFMPLELQKAEARYHVTVSAVAADIRRQRSVMLSCTPTNNFPELRLEVLLIPAKQTPEILPACLYISRVDDLRTAVREVIAVSETNVESLRVETDAAAHFN